MLYELYRVYDLESLASHQIVTPILITFLVIEWCDLILFLYMIHIIFVNMPAKRYYFTL